MEIDIIFEKNTEKIKFKNQNTQKNLKIMAKFKEF